MHRFSDSYTGFSTLFKSIVDRHAPIKTKIVRGNNKPFMNKELSNALKTKSRIKNKWNKWRSRENFLEWQNIKKNVTTSLGRPKRIILKKYFQMGLLQIKIYGRRSNQPLVINMINLNQILSSKKEKVL